MSDAERSHLRTSRGRGRHHWLCVRMIIRQFVLAVVQLSQLASERDEYNHTAI